MKAALKRIQDEIIGWAKKPAFWLLLAAGIILFVGICFYRGLVVHYACLVLHWFFKDPESTRNVIYLFAAVIGAYLLFWRTKIALREANTSEQNFKITEQNIKITEQNIKTRDQKIIDEQISRAIEELAGRDPFTRLNGISGLEKIADTQDEERMKIARILVSFIRTQAPKNSKRTREDLATCNLSKLETIDDFSAYRAQRLDIEAAVNTLASITSDIEKQGQFREEYYKTKHHLCDLQNTDLRGLRFIKTDLSKFIFAGADMSGTWLAGANLTHAWLHQAHIRERTKLIKAFLEGVNFNGAILNFVNFKDVEHLKNANFKGAFLIGANFTGVQMIEGNLNNTKLEKANFTKAFLSEVKIKEAALKDTNLTDASFLSMQGLRQHQLEDAFRWKGHNTFVTSVEGYSLEPPPEKEKPIGFWVYKIWKPPSVAHARIHVPWCPFCNNGNGTKKNKEPKGYRYNWTQCNNYEEAVKILDDFKEKHNCDNVKNCGYCESRGDLPPS